MSATSPPTLLAAMQARCHFGVNNMVCEPLPLVPVQQGDVMRAFCQASSAA